MASTFIPGYLAELSIGAVDLEQTTASGTLTLNKNIMAKPTAGDIAPVVIAGQRTGSLALAGHCSVEDVTLLNTAYDSDVILAFVFQIGDTTAPDAGAYSGSCLVEALTFEYDAEGQWSFSMDAPTSGDVTFTAPT